MRETNLRGVDLNLLVVLEALLRERHITRAATSLSMSQPAVSRALGRLRETFDDPLLVRGPAGLTLSERAEGLRQPLADLLAGLSGLVAAPDFEPADATGSLRIGCLDLEAAIYLPDLVPAIRQNAPNMQLEIYSHPDDYFALLAEGRLHLAISGLEPWAGAAQFHRRVIDHTHSEVLMGQDNALADPPMTLERYSAARHGVVSITGRGPAMMDERLARQGVHRQVALKLSSFANVPDACANSDVIFSLPHRLTRRLAARDGRLVTRPLPGALQEQRFPMYLYWHARHHNDAMSLWFRRLLLQTIDQRIDHGDTADDRP